MKKMILLLTCLAFFTIKNQAQTVTDYDGNVYNTVTIGTQVWLKENLKVTHYRNGNSIPNETDNTYWTTLTDGAYCYYDNDINNASIYGALYNWYTVADSRNLCPIGWHVPDDAEWTILATYLGGDSAGYKMKEAGTTHWFFSSGNNSDNSSGFTALGGGYRWCDGVFYDLRLHTEFWSTTEYDNSIAWVRHLAANAEGIYRYSYYYKTSGCSIRCVKDSTANQINNINYEDRLRVYPCPANDKITIETIPTPKESILSIYNINGKEMLKQQIINSKIQIDISNLPCGIYYIKLINVKNIEVRRFVKE